MRGRCYGALDIPLSEEGRSQALQTAEYLSKEPLSAIYSSPLTRAAESAAIVAGPHCCAVQTTPDLCELNFGALEGLTFDEVSAAHPELYQEWMRSPTEVLFPGGESFSIMRTRVLRAFHQIRSQHDGHSAAIVSHAGVNRILLGWALQVPDSHVFRIGQDYAAVNLLTFSNDFPAVSLLNYTHYKSR